MGRWWRAALGVGLCCNLKGGSWICPLLETVGGVPFFSPPMKYDIYRDVATKYTAREPLQSVVPRYEFRSSVAAFSPAFAFFSALGLACIAGFDCYLFLVCCYCWIRGEFRFDRCPPVSSPCVLRFCSFGRRSCTNRCNSRRGPSRSTRTGSRLCFTLDNRSPSARESPSRARSR